MTRYFKHSDELGEEVIYAIPEEDIEEFYSLYGWKMVKDGEVVETFSENHYLGVAHNGSKQIYYVDQMQISNSSKIDGKFVFDGYDHQPDDCTPYFAGAKYFDGHNWVIFETANIVHCKCEEIEFNPGNKIESTGAINGVYYSLYKTSEGYLEYVSSLWQGSGYPYFREVEREWESLEENNA